MCEFSLVSWLLCLNYDCRWKLGQLRPGDTVQFKCITFDAARQLASDVSSHLQAIRAFVEGSADERFVSELTAPPYTAQELAEPQDPKLEVLQSPGKPRVVFRQVRAVFLPSPNLTLSTGRRCCHPRRIRRTSPRLTHPRTSARLRRRTPQPQHSRPLGPQSMHPLNHGLSHPLFLPHTPKYSPRPLTHTTLGPIRPHHNLPILPPLSSHSHRELPPRIHARRHLLRPQDHLPHRS